MTEPRYRATVSTCRDCGRTYSNLYAHIEECTGPPRAKPRQVELTDSQLEFFRGIHNRTGSHDPTSVPEVSPKAAVTEGAETNAGTATGGTERPRPLHS